MMFGIGKSKTLKAGRKIPLRYVGDVDANSKEVMQERKQFAAKCYGQNQLSSSEDRCTRWKNNTVDQLLRLLQGKNW